MCILSFRPFVWKDSLPPPLFAAMSSSSASVKMPAEIQAMVAEYLELSPGVFATPAVLTRMIALVEAEKRYCLVADDVPAFGMPNRTVVSWTKRGRLSGLRVTVEIAVTEARDYGTNRPAFDRAFPATSDGLLAGIVESREVLANLKRGLCEPCLALRPPEKKMKGVGFAVCGGCALSAAFGCKRAY